MQATLSPNGQITEGRVKIARTLDEVETLRDFWRANSWHPRMDLDVFLGDQRQRSGATQPYVVTLSKEDAIVGLLAGRLEDCDFEIRLGYWSVWKPKLRAIVIPNAGILGDFSRTNAEQACRALLAGLQRGEAEAVLFDFLPVESDLFKVVRSLPKPWWRNAFVRSNPHWKIRLPAKAEELWNRSHHRRAWVRRIFKKIEADHPGKVNFRFFRDPADVDLLCRDADQVAAKSYQRGLGVGFTNDEESRERLLEYARLGILRACVLDGDGVPRSFWIGSVYKSQFFSAYLAHDSVLEKYEIGSLVFIKLLEVLCAEGAQRVDLGQGEGFYKQRFADICDSEACLYVLSASARNLCLNAGFSLGEALVVGAKKGLASFNALQSLKTRWRKRLIKKNADQ
jgi:hypothetical protein